MKSTTAKKSATTLRVYWIDWVRFIATILTSIYHGNRFFDIQLTDLNLHDSYTMDLFTKFMSQWLMPLFFFISGYSITLFLNHHYQKHHHQKSSTEKFHHEITQKIHSGDHDDSSSSNGGGNHDNGNGSVGGVEDNEKSTKLDISSIDHNVTKMKDTSEKIGGNNFGKHMINTMFIDNELKMGNNVMVSKFWKIFFTFLKERFIKLLLPGIVGVSLLASLERYISAKYHNPNTSFWIFFPKFFTNHFSLSHLWFVFALFFLSLINFPFFYHLIHSFQNQKQQQHHQQQHHHHHHYHESIVKKFIMSYPTAYVVVILSSLFFIFPYILVGKYYGYILATHLSLVYALIFMMSLSIIWIYRLRVYKLNHQSNKMSSPLPPLFDDPLTYYGGFFIVGMLILNQIILLSRMNPLPSLNNQELSLSSIVLMLVMKNSFFVAGFISGLSQHLHQSITNQKKWNKESKDDEETYSGRDYDEINVKNNGNHQKIAILNLLAIVMVPMIIFLVPQDRGYVHLDRAYDPQPQRSLFEVGTWFFIFLICSQAYLHCNSTIFSYKIFDYVRNLAYSIYLFHNVWLYLIASHCKENIQNVFLLYFLVQGGTLIGCTICHVVIRLTKITRLLFGQKI